MRTASTTEWILCRLTSKERAAAMVGDLVEMEERKGPLWFWFSVCGLVASLAWRRLLAKIVAFYAAGWMLHGFTMAANSIYAKHLPLPQWGSAFQALVLVGSTLCGLACFNTLRADGKNSAPAGGRRMFSPSTS